MDGGADWIAAAHAEDCEIGREVAGLLGEPAPEGGTFAGVRRRPPEYLGA